MQSWIFRFVSILGERYTHSHIFDFCRQLFSDASRLEVLGNGHTEMDAAASFVLGGDQAALCRRALAI
jgi:hypothetical protein